MMRRNPTVLLISTDFPLIETIRGVLSSIASLDLVVHRRIDEARSKIAVDDVALVLVHQESAGEIDDVIHLLRVIADAKRSLPMIVISNLYRPEQALTLLRSGVADFLSRPLDLSRLTYLIDALTVRARLIRPVRVPGMLQQPAPMECQGGGEPSFFQSASAMDRMMDQVRRVASQDTTILLGGETGTGKTRLARLIHQISPRRELPFLVVNCGALSPTLIESEMFGHIKGAFTGADRDHTGKFAEVGCGTLLLDEIDALSPSLQAKLLRAVEERIFEPVGSNKSMPVQGRIIAASNRPLAQESAANRFRADLYYRLNVISFTLTPLRERRDMIPHLAANFIAEFSVRSGREVDGLSGEALEAVLAYDWPGNIRELRNVIERAIVLSTGIEIQLDDLPEQLSQFVTTKASLAAARSMSCPIPAAVPTLARTKDDAELVRITDALQRNRNNRLRAAAELGISRMTLYKKLHKHGLMGSPS
jgi:two-component system, NtrC family, response regulator HydG